MKLPFQSRTLYPPVAAIAATLIATLSGCISNRSLMENLAKTVHHPVQDSRDYASMNAFQQDFLFLTEMLRETHAEPYAAWSKEEFGTEQRRLLQVLAAETSRTVFERSLPAVLSRLQDSHTTAQLSWWGGQRQYPVSFFWIKDTLILASVGSERDTALIGSPVLAFNRLPAEEVLTRFTRFIAYESMHQARRVLQYYFVFPTFHREAGVTLSDTLELTLLPRDGMQRAFTIMPVEKPKRIAPYATHPVTEKVNRPFRYTILGDRHACYLQWNTMLDIRIARQFSFPLNPLLYPLAWYYGLRRFENFLEDMFEEMEEEGVRTLIVDLRNNGGGSSVYGEQLLYHLDVPSSIRTYSMAVRFSPLYREFAAGSYAYYDYLYGLKYGGAKLPDSLMLVSDFVPEDSSGKTYFRNVTNAESDYYIGPDRKVFHGKVYFLVGEGTYSSAIILSSIVKDNRLFLTVGQPTRGRPSHYGETLLLKLPNSGIICRISCKKLFRPDTAKDSEDSLYPDVEVWPTHDDYRYGRDPVFEWVLKDAEKNLSVK